MAVEVGAIIEGKVTGITKFGAFVSLPGGRSGLVAVKRCGSEITVSPASFASPGREELNFDTSFAASASVG